MIDTLSRVFVLGKMAVVLPVLLEDLHREKITFDKSYWVLVRSVRNRVPVEHRFRWQAGQAAEAEAA